MNEDIPLYTTGDKKTDGELAIKLMAELQSIGQAIGKLNIAMRRCRTTTSAKFMDYEAKSIKLDNRGADIRSFISTIIRNNIIGDSNVKN